MKLRSALIAAVALSLTAGLSGCVYQDDTGAKPTEEQESPYYHYSFEQKLPDGRKVLCVWASEGDGSGGPSCDWAGLAAERR